MAESRTTYYRRRPGVAWLAGAVAIPLLIAGAGLGLTAGGGAHDAAVAASSASAEPLDVGPLTVSFDDDGITATGILNTEGAKQRLEDSLRSAAGDTNLVAKIGVDPQVTAAVTGLDFTGAAPVFEAAEKLPDCGLLVDGSSIALRGTATNAADSQALQDAVAAVWPGLTVLNQITVDETAGTHTPATPETPATPAPETPATPAPQAQDCANLPTEVLNMPATTPLYFATGDATVTPYLEQGLATLAGKVTACPDGRLTLVGYTDNTGDDAVNQALSLQRAQAVAAVLVAHGVPADRIEAVGQGAADPIGDNNTEDGRLHNRRVTIRVS